MSSRSVLRATLLGSSRVLFDVAVVGLLFVGHQLWLTDVIAKREQRALVAQYEREVLGIGPAESDATQALDATPAPSDPALSDTPAEDDLGAFTEFPADTGFADSTLSSDPDEPIDTAADDLIPDGTRADDTSADNPDDTTAFTDFGPSSGPYASAELARVSGAESADDDALGDDPVALGPLPARIPDPVLAADATPTGVLGIIEIPRLGVRQVIQDGIDPERLKQGTGLFRNAPPPGHQGNVIIAGHRTTYGRPFHDIDRLSAGDEIVLTNEQGRWVYRVEWQRIVEPSNREVTVQDRDARELTLVTCHPRYSARKRLIVRAVIDRLAPAAPTKRVPRLRPSVVTPDSGVELATATFDDESGDPELPPPTRRYWWLRAAAIVAAMVGVRFFFGGLVAALGGKPWMAKALSAAPVLGLMWFLFAAAEHLISSQI